MAQAMAFNLGLGPQKSAVLKKILLYLFDENFLMQNH